MTVDQTASPLEITRHELLHRIVLWQPPGHDKTYVGQEGDVTFRATVVDVRNMFGRIEVRIQPLDGSGQRWVGRTTVVREDAR